MNKTKVAFVLLGAYPYFNEKAGTPATGGAEVDLYNISKHLDKSLFEVHFIVGDFGQAKVETREGVILHKLSKGSLLALLFLLNKIQPRVIFSKGISWQTVYLIVIKKLLRKNLIIKSSHKRNLDGSLNSTLSGKLCKIFINSVDSFILQNEGDRPLFEKNYPSFRNNLSCIRNFQDIPEINKHGPFKKTLLWIGRAEEFKRPHLYLEIAESLLEWECVMIMPQSKKFLYTEVKDRAAQIPNMVFYPGVERSSVEHFYQKSAFLVSTSSSEGFPNVVLEALKNGTPILSCSDYDALIKKNHSGLVAENTGQMILFLREMTPSSWQEMSQAAHSLAREEFNVQKTIGVYQELLAK